MYHSYPKNDNLANAFYWAKILLRVAVAAIVGCVIGSSLVNLAHAAGNSIPDRYALLRIQLECDEYESIRFVGTHRAWLTLLTDEDVDEITPHFIPGAAATAVLLETHQGSVAKLYQSSDGPGIEELAAAMRRPPCTNEQDLVQRHTAYDPNYCLGESDYGSLQTLLNAMIWRQPDVLVADRLREQFNQTGIPVVTRVHSIDASTESDTSLASVATMHLSFRFAQSCGD